MTATSLTPETHLEPWLSLLIPVYNVSAYIDACLHSILQQVGQDAGVEILLLDDAGTDDSWDKVQRVAQQHPQRLQLLRHTQNRGLSAARNSLLGAARGRYVWFLDSDDVLLPGALLQLQTALATDAPDLLLCDYAVLRERRSLRHRLRGEAHQRSHPCKGRPSSRDRSALVTGLMYQRQFHAWSKIARREVWQAAPFPEGRYFEDMAAIPNLLAATTTWRHVAQPWVGYRQRGDSILATMTAKKTQDLLASARDLHDGVQQLPGGLNASEHSALQYFLLRTFANLARSKTPRDAALTAHCHTALLELFPNGTRAALTDCHRRGWWLRAARVRRSLAHAGWLT